MTIEEFRRISLTHPGAAEGRHNGHSDFRVDKKVFATLGYPQDGWAMVKLTREQREQLIAAEPTVYHPVKGGWGKTGATLILLEQAHPASVTTAVAMAWSNRRGT